MIDGDVEETFELGLIKEAIGVRESAVLEWAGAFKLTTMADSVSSRQAAILGAVLTMKKHSPGKAGSFVRCFCNCWPTTVLMTIGLSFAGFAASHRFSGLQSGSTSPVP